MDAITFIKERRRMCDTVGCEYCPINEVLEIHGCEKWIDNNPEQAVSIVDEWSKEHPTYTVNLGALNERQKRALRELGDAIIKIAEQSVQVIKEEFLPDYKAPKEDNE